MAGIAVVLISVLRDGAPWSHPAGRLLLLALVLVAGAVVLARVTGDSGAGALVGGFGLLFAAAGGGLLLAGTGRTPVIGAPQLLTGSAAVLVAGVASYLGVVGGAAFFAAAVTGGVVGVVAAWIGTANALDGPDVAAIIGPVVFAFSPVLASLAIRIGRLPMPVLPRTTADLVRDDPLPPRHKVYGAVLRADGLLTGMLGGLMLTEVACLIVLLRDHSSSATLLAELLCVGCLIRARLYPIVKQRLMLLIPGLVGVAGLVLCPLSRQYDDPVRVVVPLVLVGVAAAIVLGLRYSATPPTPYFGRYAEILEVLVTLSLVPVACAVLGLYAVVRGLGG
jgi:type VII secretion integral membrane protein EccD